jgi:hypothetical protein
MTSGHDLLPAYPQYAHQLQALLRRLAREDREAIGASLRRGGFCRPNAEAKQGVAHGRMWIIPDTGTETLSPYPEATRVRQRYVDAGSGSGRSTSIDFSRASPLSATARQTGPVRIPHFDMVRISRTVVPRAKDGSTHPRYPAKNGIAADHFGYVTRGSVADFETHLDYIIRSTAVEALDTGLLIDMLDMEEDRQLQNHLAIISNIPGGRERERSLFEAAERCERQAKGGTLQVSIQYADDWMLLATQADAPGWVRKAAMTLHQKRVAQKKKAKTDGRPQVDVTIDVAQVNLEQAYDRLVWCDDAAGLPANARPNWKAGPCGRIQTRFVGEFPRGLKPAERRLILERLCGGLSEEGWMFVAAIHRPDETNDPDNFHFHIDAYDRPSRWLSADKINAERKPSKPFEGDGCWDFEYSERKRNGRPCYPYRQNKIAEPTRDVPSAGEKAMPHFLAGKRYLRAIRRRYVDIVNEVVDGRAGIPVYATGTYKDAKIRLTPMEHLGPAITAKEVKGEVTPGGTRNAQIRFNDEMQLLLDNAVIERLDNSIIATLQQSGRVSAASLEAAERWKALSDAAVTRRCQAALVDVVERMVRSRAETVLRVATASRTVKEQARTWLGQIDTVMTRFGQQALAVARLRDLDDKVEKAWTEVLSVTGDGPERLRYVPTDSAKLSEINAISPTYRVQVEGRLHRWLTKHGRRPDHLRFVPGGYAIAKAVPPTIHRLFRLLGDEPAIQTLLLAERQRRKVVAASMAVAGDMIETDHDRRSILPGAGAGHIPADVHRGAQLGQPRLLADVDCLHEIDRLQALPTIQQMRRSDIFVEPSQGADDVAATALTSPPDRATANSEPAREDYGVVVPDTRRRNQRASLSRGTNESNMPDEQMKKSTALLDQAAAAAADRQSVQKPAGIPVGNNNTGGKGPAPEAAGVKIDKGQER